MACADDAASSSNRTDSSSQNSRLMALALPLAMRSIAMLSWWDTSIMVGYTDRLGPAVRMALLGGIMKSYGTGQVNEHSLLSAISKPCRDAVDGELNAAQDLLISFV